MIKRMDWIKLYLRLKHHPLWLAEPFTKGQAWVDLLMLTSYNDGFFYKRGVRIRVKRGQCAWSELGLAERWRWSRGKVRRFLDELETEQQIIQQKSNVTTLITVINYEQHQARRTPNGTAGGSPNGHQTDTLIDSIERKEEDTTGGDPGSDMRPLTPSGYQEFIQLFNGITGRRFRRESKSQSQFAARTKEGYSSDDFQKAINNCYNDPHHKRNPHFLTPEFITRSDKLQKYLNYQSGVDGNKQGAFA